MQITQQEQKQRSIHGAYQQGALSLVGSALLLSTTNTSGLGAAMLLIPLLVLFGLLHLVCLLTGLARHHLPHYQILPPVAIYGGMIALILLQDALQEQNPSDLEYERNPPVNVQYINLGKQALGAVQQLAEPSPIEQLSSTSQGTYPEECSWWADQYHLGFHFSTTGAPLLKEGLWNDAASVIEVCELDATGSCHYRQWPVSRIPTPQLDRVLPRKPSNDARSSYVLYFLNGRAEVIRRFTEMPSNSTSILIRNFTGKMVSRLMVDDFLAGNVEHISMKPALDGICGDQMSHSMYVNYPGKLPKHITVSWRNADEALPLLSSQLDVPHLGFFQSNMPENSWELLLYPHHTELRLVKNAEREAFCEQTKG